VRIGARLIAKRERDDYIELWSDHVLAAGHQGLTPVMTALEIVMWGAPIVGAMSRYSRTRADALLPIHRWLWRPLTDEDLEAVSLPVIWEPGDGRPLVLVINGRLAHAGDLPAHVLEALTLELERGIAAYVPLPNDPTSKPPN
jgi:hypothetical protein